VARARTTKELAQRIDLNYFKRPTPFKHAKFWLSLGVPLLGLLWIVGRGISSDRCVYSSGSLSRAHAVLENECAACHVRQAGGVSAKAADRACLDCHDGPQHHASRIVSPRCATCHAEHRGRVPMAAASDQACATCHAALGNSQPDTRYASRINSLEDGHPEFAALGQIAAPPAGDSPAIKLNHSIHMQPIRRGPNGILVNLACGNCHRPTGVEADLTYSDRKYRAAAVSYKASDEILPARAEPLRGPKPTTGRELMAPVQFANACAACHLLTFDKRFDEGVPHDKPEVVHAFLLEKFQQYIAAHPSELRVTRDPTQEPGGKLIPQRVQVFTVSQWVTERMGEAEELLWRKTCKQCHALTISPGGSLPQVAPANVKTQWMPHAKFDHDAHRGFSCVSCHAKALTSTEASDTLLPGIAICKTCHGPGPGHADARCSECHTYHDWSKRKEVTPRFTLPALRTGGQ
jgi:transcription elongation factor Elf1